MMAKSSVLDLDPSWFDPFKTVLQQVLATKEAELTFAQIIDGLPTAPIAFKYGVDDMRSDIIDRAVPCGDSLSIFQSFREKFDTSTLQLDLQA
ncbi:hypothetical protein LOZ53_001441 [Ophidiomyces ophidiicola]|uniref:Uncharacterized protein n=1 Tax=Ophidiomyces ophidiicola TaxID=1387563 RepID=A0ACB8V2B2_9EURO|nr:hypothetical protein LOZ64_001595 [Ophidiomyces ophidiicola]KAI1950256.1 hypothetical protein LOZ62_002003 [Ophidiomyces ophidiicola]KAI1980007.1 hypothetical protein LOZ55_001664 [Ophidiomyces ophidiicola]KAI1995388.1 hypothetical protein LOZ53_001441 [Ophidiomyces ophidiicola]KAI2000650.1 hypothetical protein LOZ51_000935 [Ophidiomyces ophidiicola]